MYSSKSMVRILHMYCRCIQQFCVFSVDGNWVHRVRHLYRNLDLDCCSDRKKVRSSASVDTTAECRFLFF